jgi:DNA-binding response OmpR family regulator/curved DNA-binding protein CbpA
MASYVLVVESNPALARRINEALGEAHYSLSTEAELTWARRTLDVRAPDAIILDTTLSDGSGFALADEVRRNPSTARIPIFFIASTHRGASHQAEAQRRFAPAEYLPTPLDADHLLARLLETVPPSEAPEAQAVPNYPGAAAADSEQKRERRAVETTAKHFAEGESDLRGSLARQPFARVLQRIYSARMSGALLLARGDTKKIVNFEEGYPVSVRSNMLSECLGQILLEQRLISAETLAESLRRMKETHQHQGEVLVAMGALSPYNLSRALMLQMESKVLEIFSWSSGDFMFKKDQSHQDAPMRLERTPAALILDGIRRHYDAERIHSVLEPLSGKYLAPSPDPRRRLQDITADANERRFIDGLDGTVKLETALASSPIPIDRARLLLVAMSEAGMITPSQAPPRGQKDESRHTPRPVDLGGASASTGERSREELVALLAVMRVQSHFEVLGVEREATPVEIGDAYHALARDFHPDLFRLRSDDVRDAARQIFERLEKAFAVLRDSSARRKYLAELQRTPLPARSDAEGGDGSESAATAAERVYFTGVSHLRARRYPQAAEAFRQATTLAPKQASYRSALGWALYRQAPADTRALAAGLAELRRAVETEPANPWVRISLGRFYAETGLPDDAIREFEAALGMSPGLADIEEEIRRLKGET